MNPVQKFISQLPWWKLDKWTWTNNQEMSCWCMFQRTCGSVSLMPFIIQSHFRFSFCSKNEFNRTVKICAWTSSLSCAMGRSQTLERAYLYISSSEKLKFRVRILDLSIKTGRTTCAAALVNKSWCTWSMWLKMETSVWGSETEPFLTLIHETS